MATPKITLYTNHRCPWAHRAHIALKGLGLPYEEVIINLDVPREPSYLAINPRGLVPSISYNGEIIIESAIVAQFLADAHPSTLLPASNAPDGALVRARIAIFVDTYFSKVQPHFMSALRANTDSDRAAATETFVAAVAREIEPLLETKGSGPFFGGSESLTLAEVLTGSFLLRVLSFWKPEIGLLGADLPDRLEKQAPRFKQWAEATVQQEAVNFIWNEAGVAERTKYKLGKLGA